MPEWLSLFKAFGHGEAHERELGRIAALVERNARMSNHGFTATMRTLRGTGVLHGTSMLCITPKLLHIHLWVEWRCSRSSTMAPNADDLLGSGGDSDGSRDMLQWYLDMFRHARRAPEASKVVKGVMRQGGCLDSNAEMGGWPGEDFFGPQEQ